jgi:hypothetical protein
MRGLVRFHQAGAPVGIAPSPGTYPSFDTYAGNRMRVRPNPVQEGMRVPLPLVPVGFTMPVANAAGGTLSGRPQGLYRVSRLIVGSAADTSGGFGVQVSNIVIGVDTCMAQLGPLPAANFAFNAVDCSVTFPTAPTALDCAITVTNITGTTASIGANFLGEFLKGGGIALDG